MSTFIRRCAIIMMLAVLSDVAGVGQELNTYNYTYYRTSDGLCDEYVFDVMQDSRGFMWFCTSNGLDRFDGNDFVHYCTSASREEHRSRSNFFLSIAEDDSGFIWVISDIGLMRISLDSGRLVAASELTNDTDSLLSRRASAIFKDNRGMLWLSVENFVLHLILDKDGNICEIERNAVHGNIKALCQQENAIWAGGNDGLHRYVLTSDGHSVEMPLESGHPLSGITDVSALDSQGVYLRIGTARSGLYSYDMQTRSLRHFMHDAGDTGSLSGNQVTCIETNQSGDVLVGTTNGISLLNHGWRFVRIGCVPGSKSLNDNHVNRICVDREGNIWVGTALGGVNIISMRKSAVTHLFPSDMTGNNVVVSLYNDDSGNIFAGIAEKGMRVVFNEGGLSASTMVSHNPKDSHSLADNNVMSVIQDMSGNYWLATRNGGLDFLDRKDLKHMKFRHYTTENSGISSNSVYDLALDSLRGGIWVLHQDGLDFLNTSTCEFTKADDLLGVDIRLEKMMTVMCDSQNRLWIGGAGLSVIDMGVSNGPISQDAVRYFEYKLDQQESGISERISVIHEYVDGNVYIGSQSNGLYLCTTDSAGGLNFVNYPLVFGSKISCINDGDNHRLWISTINGAYYFDPSTLQVVKYDSSDGLASGQFYVKSGTPMPGGAVCLGTIDGAVIIDPPGYMSSTIDRNVVVTYVHSGDNKVRPIGEPVYELGPDENTIEIGFSAQEYVNPDKVLYAYKIEELDSFWTVEPNAKKVRYKGLKSGSYTFSIHCTNSDNLWSSRETKLKIVVLAPFYQTWWFYSGMILLVLCVIGLIVYVYMRRQKSIQKLLITKIRQRTHRLTEQTEQLRQKNEEISEQKNQLEEFSRQIQNSNKEKLMMFTSLTHEFKTPLTLILGPARRLLKGNENPVLNESIQIINRNANHLLSLVNQIMDLRQIDAGTLKISKEDFNIIEEFENDMQAFQDLLSERKIDFESRMHICCPIVLSDRGFLHKILFNLMSNAIKYTPNGGRIICRIAQRRSKSSDMVMQYISVSNTGSYISPEECGRIFDCYYKIENQSTYTSYGQSSTGIGLYLVKQILSTLGGKIMVKSDVKRGTVFRVCYPAEPSYGLPKSTLRNSCDNIPVDNVVEDIPFSAPRNPDKPIVLLVEDSRDMRNYIKSLIDDRYSVAEAINGERGYALAKSIVPDFIISDLMMPRCDGLEFCRLVRSDSELCHIPFLMLTALSDYDSRFESYKENVDAYLTKPFRPEMLIARIEAILANRRNQQHLIATDLSNPYPKVEMEDADKKFIKRLADIMKDNYSDPDFSVGNMSELMGMSASKLYNKINALTGMPAVGYIRLYRLQTARRFMEESRGKSGVSVSEIAYAVGFNDPKYFARCFVKQFGVQPRAFLKGV